MNVLEDIFNKEIKRHGGDREEGFQRDSYENGFVKGLQHARFLLKNYRDNLRKNRIKPEP